MTMARQQSKRRAARAAPLARGLQSVRAVSRACFLIPAALVLACSEDVTRAPRPAPGPPIATIEIHQPERLTSVVTDELDALGRPVRVACVTCHSLRPPAPLPRTMAELDEFHTGLRFAHGELSCGSCHAPDAAPALRLADGTRVELQAAILLCRQCHGPQARDYDHGAHGGMTGHWDLSAGGRTRNHCVDCHDPHSPAFEPTRPVLPPRDHGLTRRSTNGDR